MNAEKEAVPREDDAPKEAAAAEDGAAAAPKEGEAEGEAEEGAEQTSSDEPTSATSAPVELEHERRPSFLEDVIDENHPEVIAAVEAALAHAREQQFKLPVNQWLDVLEQEIQKAESERRERLAGPEMYVVALPLPRTFAQWRIGLESSPPYSLQHNSFIWICLCSSHGGWVLDNFPRSPDEWTAYLERAALKKLMPDDLVVLRDQSDTQDALIKRWYKLNRASIDAAVSFWPLDTRRTLLRSQRPLVND